MKIAPWNGTKDEQVCLCAQRRTAQSLLRDGTIMVEDYYARDTVCASCFDLSDSVIEDMAPTPLAAA